LIQSRKFIDLGDGAGALVASILRKNPTMKGGVLDAVEIIAQARANFHSAGGTFADVAAQVPDSYLVEGNFMKEVPAVRCT
jgi:16S rRNA G1207 methylase RsmC